MAYLQPSDFRVGSLHEVCQTLELDTNEADDTRLADAITRLSRRIDEATRDHFESEPLTLDMDGSGHRKLNLPYRTQAVSAVALRAEDGTLTTQDAAAYRLHSSLRASGSKADGMFDWLEIVVGGVGLTGWPLHSSGPWYWPRGPQTVQVIGTFGWAVTPGDVKRALALWVWDHFKSQRGDLHRAVRKTTADQAIDFAITEPSGIPEVDEILADFARMPYMAVA